MAVQAQYPSNPILFKRNVEEGKMILGNNKDCVFQQQARESFVEPSYMNFNNNGGVNPRKRSREVSEAPHTTTPRTTTTNMNPFSFSQKNIHRQQSYNHNHTHQLIDLSQLQNNNQKSPNVVSTGLRLSFGDQIQQQRQQQQQQPSSVFSMLNEELSLQSKQQSDELNYFLHVQGEQMRRTLAEKCQQHYRALILATEEAVGRQLQQKEVEVQKVAIRNAELEARVAQLGLEAQSWQAKAQAQEAHATALQAQLQQAISVDPCGIVEAYGLGCVGDADDSESACVDPVSEHRVNSHNCKVCQRRNASVVLLPCRHLCVCKECDDVVHACPVCPSIRTASVEVYLT